MDRYFKCHHLRTGDMALKKEKAPWGGRPVVGAVSPKRNGRKENSGCGDPQMSWPLRVPLLSAWSDETTKTQRDPKHRKKVLEDLSSCVFDACGQVGHRHLCGTRVQQVKLGPLLSVVIRWIMSCACVVRWSYTETGLTWGWVPLWTVNEPGFLVPSQEVYSIWSCKLP